MNAPFHHGSKSKVITPGRHLSFVIGVSFFCLLPLLLTGCFETTQEFTLNPDGSGKVIHESSFQNVNLSGDNEPTEESLKEAIAKIIEDAKGVEAWRDVSYKRLDDGRLYFKGTAYFKNLSKLDLPNQTLIEFDWSPAAYDGSGVLTLRTNKGGDGDGFKMQKKPVDLSKLSPEERAKKIKEERLKFQQVKPMMAGFMTTMKHEVTFHMPGQPGSHCNFTPDSRGAMHLKFEGSKLLGAMEKLVNDDAWFAKNLGSFGGADKPAMDEQVNELLFGSNAPVSVTVSSLEGITFSYDDELAEAKKEFVKIKKQLGVGPVTVAPPAKGGALKSLKVVGMRLVTGLDQKRDLRPFYQDAGYTLCLLAELPGSVLSITDKSGLDTAIADDGSSLLLESEWKRRFSSPNLSKDKAAVLFEVELKAPGVGVKGLKELSGHLQYNVASGTKEIDLGFTEIVAKAKGTELGAMIESIEEGWQKDGSQLMQLKLKTGKDALKAVHLVVGDARTELKQSGYGGGGNSYTFTYESKTAFPAQARLVAEIYDALQTFDVPFKLENISLLGTPREN